MNPRVSAPLMNQSGVVTVEFIFSFVIASCLSVLLFTVCYTLSVVEVSQYVVFASARAHLASNKDPSAQRQAAIAKFTQLTTGRSAIATLYDGTWFVIAKPSELDIRQGLTGDGRTFGADLAGGSDLRNWFIGVSAPLTAKIMAMTLPILGSTNPDNDGNFFKTRVNAMMIREPSQKECQDFMEQRRSALSALPSGQKFYQPNSYVAIEDNGC